MKNRDNKHFAPNTFWHVFNRGNGKQNVFLDLEDFRFFLLRLRENLFPSPEDGPLGKLGGASLIAEAHTPYIRKKLPPEAFALLCYCLMPNHFHFLIRQNTTLPISKLIAKVCTSYSMYFNKKYGKVGNLFQSKFKAVLVTSDEQLMWTSAYIHNNPKVAGLTEKLENYPWSSYPDYIGKRQGTICDKEFILKMFKNISEYEKFVSNSFEVISTRKEIQHLLLDN
jgi:putative transposase